MTKSTQVDEIRLPLLATDCLIDFIVWLYFQNADHLNTGTSVRTLASAWRSWLWRSGRHGTRSTWSSLRQSHHLWRFRHQFWQPNLRKPATGICPST